MTTRKMLNRLGMAAWLSRFTGELCDYWIDYCIKPEIPTGRRYLELCEMLRDQLTKMENEVRSDLQTATAPRKG
jgi:hypothetical protein